MTNDEIDFFIEKTEEFGDIWERDDVERVYGGWTLEDALADRRSDFLWWANIVDKVINRPRNDGEKK